MVTAGSPRGLPKAVKKIFQRKIFDCGGTCHTVSGSIRIAIRRCGFEMIIRRIISGHQLPSLIANAIFIKKPVVIAIPEKISGIAT